jgi:CHAD domain-containing protein
MRDHAAGKTAHLLGRIVYEVRGVSRRADAGAVHDMRVAIRRLLQCLRLFKDFYPPGKVKKIRRDLKGLMSLSAVVRDRDIAMSLLREAAMASDSDLLTTLWEQRKKAAKELEAAAKLWKERERSRKWRVQLVL